MIITINNFSQQYGIKAGYHAITIITKSNESTYSTIFGGFYVGTLGKFNLNKGLDLQTEIQYVNVSLDGDNASFLYIPILLNYPLSENFELLIGPQLNYIFEDLPDNYSNLGIDLALGAAFNIDKNFFIDARYAFNINNRYTGEGSSDVKLKYNTFQVGLGYKFN